jgi:hypothetical protein
MFKQSGRSGVIRPAGCQAQVVMREPTLWEDYSYVAHESGCGVGPHSGSHRSGDPPADIGSAGRLQLRWYDAKASLTFRNSYQRSQNGEKAQQRGHLPNKQMGGKPLGGAR